MTAPIEQSQFTAFLSQPHQAAAAMWCGPAIDLFAAMEATALSCFVALDAADEAKPKATDFIAWPRFKRLATILADARFVPWNGKALVLLEKIERERDLRTAVAHSRIKATVAGIRLNWRALENGTWQPRTKALSWLEALEALGRLDKLRRDLSSQLGQIRRHCLQKSLPTA